MIDWNRRLAFDDGERAWLSHEEYHISEEEPGAWIVTDKAGECYSFMADGSGINTSRRLINLTTEQEAAAERVKAKRAARKAEREALAELPEWGSFA